MIGYNELYELLRKERYGELLSALPKNFLEEFSNHIASLKEQEREGDIFSENTIRTKKQLENSISMFRELIRIRKKKILSLVFTATETGIMKRDFENMLDFEREIFEKLTKAYEECDKKINSLINEKKEERKRDSYNLIMFNSDVEQFIDMKGNTIGPFKAGELANLEKEISEILVSAGKASYIEE